MPQQVAEVTKEIGIIVASEGDSILGLLCAFRCDFNYQSSLSLSAHSGGVICTSLSPAQGRAHGGPQNTNALSGRAGPKRALLWYAA